MSLYNSIGKTYSKYRQADPRIVDEIVNLLSLKTGSVIADVGAGTGNYSRALGDRGFFVQAIEPSVIMRQQAREHPNVNWLAGCAEELPLATASVDAVVCILASHHFSDLKGAIAQMHRITKNGTILFLTFDPQACKNFWLLDYFPFLKAYDRQLFTSINYVIELFETLTSCQVEISPLKLPHDLTDMFAAAGWRQPEIYLDAEVRAGMSAFALSDRMAIARGIERLQTDLNSGLWETKYGAIKNFNFIDVGYRFLSARLV
jgi:ubiquinone/menaquinone biosynthesis C-methylase UbiE